AANEKPHSSQNFAPSLFACPQRAQISTPARLDRIPTHDNLDPAGRRRFIPASITPLKRLPDKFRVACLGDISTQDVPRNSPTQATTRVGRSRHGDVPVCLSQVRARRAAGHPWPIPYLLRRCPAV